MIKDYQYILFDLDGTVTDPKIGITNSVAHALNSFGIHVETLDELCKFIGPPLYDSFCQYYGFSESDANLAVDKYREYFGATSKPTVFATRILEHFNLLQYFKFVAGSELDGTRSKKSEVIKHALQQNAITDFSSVIMIGGRKHDIIGAKEVGVASMGVLYGYGDRYELDQAGADFIANTVEEVRSFFAH